MNTAPKAFISYSHSDKDFAHKMAEDLINSGVVGVIIGLIIGSCTFYIGYKAIIRTRDTDTHHYE